MTQTGIINIRGKEYHTVAKRVQDFRDNHPAFALTTEVIFRDTECVVVKASIADETGRTIATGHAEEYRQSSQINKTSALENAETSAIGRALAAFGIGGTEFASANEVENAIHQQTAPPAKQEKRGPDPNAFISDKTRDALAALIDASGTNIAAFCKSAGIMTLKELTNARAAELAEPLKQKAA